MGPTLLPIYGETGTLSLGVKWPERDPANHLQLERSQGNVDLHTPSGSGV
jgi:hypothetical protein